MKKLPFLLAGLALAFSGLARAETTIGLQLWSLRHPFEKSVPDALVLTEKLGFQQIETHSFYGQTAAAFNDQLAAHHMKAVSGHFGYERLGKDLDGVIADARALGLEYVVLPWIPHTEFTEADATRVAGEFNTWGAALKKAGLKFAYHPHGYEFRPAASGETPFDLIAKLTDPANVSFEMDVFWIVHSGNSPEALIKKYSGRWTMVHVKDIRKGAVTGLYTGGAPATDNVAVGDGQVNWPGLYAAAKAQGAVYFFIEDESTEPLRNIPLSLAYLKSAKL